MSKSFTLQQLTEGIRERHVGSEGKRLTEKWSRTGLLRGLGGTERENMSRLLENQAAQVLREVNSLGNGAGGGAVSGDVRGFTNIAFPIVRRVFGGLVANELVSIQPMSLPSGLLFYLDYTYGNDVGGDSAIGSDADSSYASTYNRGDSIYASPAGAGIRSGSLATGGQYDLAGGGFSKVHTQSVLDWSAMAASGAYAGGTTLTAGDSSLLHATGTDGKLIQFDPQLTKLIEEDPGQCKSGRFQLVLWKLSALASNIDLTQAKDIAFYSTTTPGSRQAGGTLGWAAWGNEFQGGSNILNLRRLNQLGTYTAGAGFEANPFVKQDTSNAVVLTVMTGTRHGDGASQSGGAQLGALNLSASYVIAPGLDIDSTDGSALTIPSFESNFNESTVSPTIPEIDIRIESIAVTAVTRKLRARWSPELAQDLNAYHSLDAEVELTQILSEQVALEIDREILNDLLTEARGANYYWSRMPGKFVNKKTGKEQTLASSLSSGPTFTGTVREWYETLVETIIDVANEIHRKTLRGSANFIVVSPDVATIFESSVLYKPSIKIDGDGQVGSPFQLGAVPVGSLSNRFTVYKDPYFPRNKVLVGYKGGSYLETGYVYAPYVPLIVTPTIFAPEDFTPRKGVMTRYGKKMVRGDFYGTVTVMDLNVI
tara:strand:+ start:47019 stop:48980 length:1962 start_codon:yes stop_codon:yes gene_type:complete